MTRAEVVRRTARKCGVADSEAKIFFEIFLNILSGKFTEGDKLRFENIGYFQLRKAKVKNHNPSAEEKMFRTIDVVLFSEEEELSNPKDGIIFSIPKIEEDDLFKSPDYHFSLSIGKPVIPLKQTKPDVIIPPRGRELRTLLYSKAERFTAGGEPVKGGKEKDSQFVIPPASPPAVPAGKKDTESIKTHENWQNENLSRQIEEESLLDLGKSTSSEFSAAESTEKPEHPANEQSSLKEMEEDLSGYEQHRKVLPGEYKPDNIPDGVDSLKEEPGLKSDMLKGTFTVPIYDERIVPKPLLRKKEKRAAYRAARDKFAEELAKEDFEEEATFAKRKSNAGIYVIIAAVIFSIAAAVIYYGPLFRNQDTIVQKVKIPVVPVIIERDYSIPVNYPYDGTINTAGFDFEPFGAVTENQGSVQAQNETGEVNKDVMLRKTREVTISSDVEKLKDNIYRYGNVIVVQVSSWKSLRKAESEVARFNAMGKSAFLEEAELSGKGKYYRVRVGNFSTVKEAEEFLSKNI